MKILAENMNRLIGPGGHYSSNAAASAASDGITRSTYDRVRNGDKAGASAIAIDKLDGIAKAFGLEVWQLFVPGIEPNTPAASARASTDTPLPWPLKKSTAERIRALTPAQLRQVDDALDVMLRGFEAETAAKKDSK
mgnify:FL=1